MHGSSGGWHVHGHTPRSGVRRVRCRAGRGGGWLRARGNPRARGGCLELSLAKRCARRLCARGNCFTRFDLVCLPIAECVFCVLLKVAGAGFGQRAAPPLAVAAFLIVSRLGPSPVTAAARAATRRSLGQRRGGKNGERFKNRQRRPVVAFRKQPARWTRAVARPPCSAAAAFTARARTSPCSVNSRWRCRRAEAARALRS